MRLCSLAALVLGLVLSVPALAQDADQQAMAKKVRAMAVGIGNAYACTEADKREVFKLEAHDLFDLIVQDVGSDMAFLYATGLGYGSGVPVDGIDCKTMLQQWEEIREDYQLKGDE